MGVVRELQEVGMQIRGREVGKDTWTVREAMRRKDQAQEDLEEWK